MEIELSKSAGEKLRTLLAITAVCALGIIGQRFFVNSSRFIPTCPPQLDKPKENNFLIYHLPDGGYILREDVISKRLMYHANHEGDITSKCLYESSIRPTQDYKIKLDATFEDSLLVKRVLREDGWLK